MPIPKPEKNEDHQKFVTRCMGNETMKKDYPDSKQRIAICLGQTKSSLLEQVCEIIEFTEALADEDGEELTKANLIVPDDSDYEPFSDEIFEEFDLSAISSEYQGRKVTLNKPFRTPDGPKKFSVYVKNDKGNVVKVNFGDPNMEIKKDIPARRKSFRARMRCDNPGPKYKARYWSCKAW
jgi:hypothetical protein